MAVEVSKKRLRKHFL
jgi:hypothetical protein